MRIGIISEGHSDRAVIKNIIIGLSGLDSSDVIALRPQYKTDETDDAVKPKTESSWSVIKSECVERDLIDEFLNQEGNDFIVIHIDTAEAELYGVTRPNKTQVDYCVKLRDAVITQINSWISEDISENLLYAIAIEETDAWILTIYDKKDSTKSVRAKEKLQHVLGKKGINSKVDEENYLKISKPLSKSKDIKRGEFLNYNESLRAFYDEIQVKVLPKLSENIE